MSAWRTQDCGEITDPDWLRKWARRRGVPYFPLEVFPHGTSGGYKRGCRCDLCRAEASQRNAAQYLKRKARQGSAGNRWT